MSFSLLANCRTNQIKIVQESLMLIVILSLFKTKEFVKEILYELFSPKGAYSTVEGTKYCRNCANNRLQFAAKTMVFVETCQNLPKLAAHNMTRFDRLLLAHCIKIKMIQDIHALIGHPLPDGVARIIG